MNNILIIFANLGRTVGDIFAILAFVGGIFTLFIRSGRWSQFVELSWVALFLGVLGQIAMAVTHIGAASIGLFQLTPVVVDGLLALSIIMIFARFLLDRIN